MTRCQTWLLAAALTGCGSRPEGASQVAAARVHAAPAAAPADHPVAVALGSQLTCALFASGQVKCWGAPPLGYGDWEIRGLTAGTMGDHLPFLDLALGSAATVTQLVAGGEHVCALISDGRVKCWGDNDDGSVGVGDVDATVATASLPFVDLGTGGRATALATGYSHTCALLADATVKCWGTSDHGQLGVPALAGKVVGNHAGDMGDALPRVDLGAGAAVKAIAASDNNTCAQLADGSLRCWGENDDGRLCLGDGNDRGVTPGDMGAALPALDFGAGATVARFAVGYATFCALVQERGRDDAALKCWGNNDGGGLGLMDEIARCTATAATAPKDYPDVNLGGLRTLDVSLEGQGCGLLENGAIKCWGDNGYGELGLGDNLSRGDQANSMGDELKFVDLGADSDVLSVTAGPAHTCAVLAPGSVKCWGDNAYGMLGLGLGVKPSVGTAPSDMGAALPPVAL